LKRLTFLKRSGSPLLVVDDGSSEASSIDYPLHTLRRSYEVEDERSTPRSPSPRRAALSRREWRELMEVLGRPPT